MSRTSASPLRAGLLAAITAFALLACSVDKTSESLVADGAKALENGRAPEAVVHLKNALSKQPDHAEARFLLGVAFNAAWNGPSAAAELRRAEGLGLVKGGRVRAELGRAMLIEGNYRIVYRILRSAIDVLTVIEGHRQLLAGDLDDDT